MNIYSVDDNFYRHVHLLRKRFVTPKVFHAFLMNHVVSVRFDIICILLQDVVFN